MKTLILSIGLLFAGDMYAQPWSINFGSASETYRCDPIVYTSTGQRQCAFDISSITPIGQAIAYTTTDADGTGADCRNHIDLQNPGYGFIGSESQLQLRNASGGNTIHNPARFVVKNFNPTSLFGIRFDVALAGYGGSYYFRCGNGEAYGDTMYMLGRDSSSFMVLKFNDENPSISQPRLEYSNEAQNLMWPNVPSYSWQQGIGSNNFGRYQKHSVAVFCNNTNVQYVYNYIGFKLLNARSFDVYIDSVLDASNVFDDYYPNTRTINSFMFGGGSAICANGGIYLGDTLIVDNIQWTSHFNTFPLAVAKLSLVLQKINRGVVLLWKNETPEDRVLDEIQYSSDGRSFKTVGTVSESSAIKTYTYRYTSPCGAAYFRIKSGTKYSDIRSVAMPCGIASISFIGHSVRIETKEAGILRITNAAGQTVQQVSIASGTATIPVQGASGLYYAEFIGSTTVVQKGIIF